MSPTTDTTAEARGKVSESANRCAIKVAIPIFHGQLNLWSGTGNTGSKGSHGPTFLQKFSTFHCLVLSQELPIPPSVQLNNIGQSQLPFKIGAKPPPTAPQPSAITQVIPAQSAAQCNVFQNCASANIPRTQPMHARAAKRESCYPTLSLASIVKAILNDDKLKAQCYQECASMSCRMQNMRCSLAQALKEAGSRHDWSHVTREVSPKIEGL